VEDDRKCRKIGGVLLDALRCNVEFAQDGLQAVTKVSAGAMYDLVLMGTAMPHLDGVSATHYIRRFNHTPIIAMASSLDDGHLAMYSEHGRHSPKQVLVRITDLNCIRNERRITEAIHVGRSAEHAQKASWPSQEGYPVNLDMWLAADGNLYEKRAWKLRHTSALFAKISNKNTDNYTRACSASDLPHVQVKWRAMLSDPTPWYLLTIQDVTWSNPQRTTREYLYNLYL
jgi:CheY-like chemotaxis protein